MENLRLFDTLAQYNSAVSDFEYPTVSYIEGEDEVMFMAEPVHDYSQDYLTFEALESGTISFNIIPQIDTDSLEWVAYSTDGGETWTETDNEDGRSEDITINVAVSAGDKILWKGGDNAGMGVYDYDIDEYVGAFFSSTCRFNAYGNIMSLDFGDDFLNSIDEAYNTRRFTRVFSDYTGTKSCLLVSAQNLILSATTAGDSCYMYMFKDCTSLITPPVISATTVEQRCCYGMFQGCTALATAPVLPATTISSTWGKNCYEQMFSGCTSLVTVPSNMLPATTLSQRCYSNMFSGCTSLTTAPELPATTLVSQCYQLMFDGCTNLNYIKAMFTSTPGSSYTSVWVRGVASSGTFIKNSTATWNVTGTSGVPTGWTVQTETPAS